MYYVSICCFERCLRECSTICVLEEVRYVVVGIRPGATKATTFGGSSSDFSWETLDLVSYTLLERVLWISTHPDFKVMTMAWLNGTMDLFWIPLLMATDFLAAMVLPWVRSEVFFKVKEIICGSFWRYFLAFYLGHVPGFMPFVSDCGVLIPERTLFSELINIAVFLQLLFSYFRYEQVSSVKNYSINR